MVNKSAEMRTLRFALAFFCVLTAQASTDAHAAIVVIDQTTIIDTANLYPEPPPNEPELFVEIKDGSAGGPIVDLVDGGVIGGYVTVADQSHLRILGGEIQAATKVVDHATLTVSGGRIAPLIRTYQSSDVIGVLQLEDSATANISAGFVFGIIHQFDSSTINIFGYGFDVVGDLPTSEESMSRVLVSGFYANGRPLAFEIARLSPDAKVFLHTVPEPSYCALGGWTCISLMQLFRRHRVSQHREHADASADIV